MKADELTALQLGAAVMRGEISPAEAVQSALDAIAEHNPHNNAFLTVNGADALARAKRMRSDQKEGPLWAVPMALKDNICTRGVKTTCASRMLADFVPPYDAAVKERLDKGGALLLGKLNMDEFGMGTTGETSHFGPVKNPWDASRAAGGSSGGAAAAVAAGECWYALGSDAGGSIRVPAAYCGVTGMRPTYGAVSRYGLIAHASSFDQIGPICKTAADCAAVLDLLRGRDARDATSVSLPGGSLLGGLDGGVRGLKIGLVEDCFCEGCAPGIARAVRGTTDVLRARGAEVKSCRLPVLRAALPAYMLLSGAEAASNLARYDGVHLGRRAAGEGDLSSVCRRSRAEGFGTEVKFRVLLGTLVLSEEALAAVPARARRARAVIQSSLRECFARFDLLLTPTVPHAPPLLGERDGTRLADSRADSFTAWAGLAGLPAISFPCGIGSDGLPVGAQLVGPPLGDAAVLRAAHAFQLDAGHHVRRAPY